MSAWRHVLRVVALALFCACRADLPAYGSVEVWVDTDAAVPAAVTRLRVDVYASGTWVSSRSFSLRDASIWPASFVVAHGSEESRSLTLRLRAYVDGAERDYLGERYVGPPAASEPDDARAPDPPRTDQPRLVVDGVDQTPTSEPAPNLTIDRLLRVETVYGQSDVVHVVLRGDCFGVMADVASGRTCIDAARHFEAAGAGDPGAGAASVVGTFPVLPAAAQSPRARSPGDELLDEEVFVPGAAFTLGSENIDDLETDAERLSAAPERMAVVAPLLVDRYEVTVARFRAALARGFVPSAAPRPNEGPLASDGTSGNLDRSCTFSAAPRPGAERREAYPLNCVQHVTARELCRFLGGDLLTEAQWEYVATTAGRALRTPFPWGTRGSGCDVIIGRGPTLGTAPCLLAGPGYGPTVVTSGPLDETPLGVHGLFGNVSEWVVDAAIDYGSAAYRRAPLDAQVYDRPDAPAFVLRGLSWSDPISALTASVRTKEPSNVIAPSIGFRCARSAE